MVFPKAEFNKASVKDANINKGTLVDLFNKIDEERFNLHNLMLVKSGSRVFRASALDFTEDTKEEVYSVSKSFTSIAIGILADLKLINLDDYVLFFFQEDVKDYLPGYETLKIKHLLTMSVGQTNDIFSELTPSDNAFELFFNQPLTYKPGERFFYSNIAVFMLSAIVTKVTGKSLNDFLNDYLYKKIGIEKPNWKQVNHISFGATGLEISTNDMARFGILLLNEGNWDGEQIVSKDYIESATKKQIASEGEALDHDGGYGYLFWINSFGGYRAAGIYGQYIVVMKDLDLVFITKAYEDRFFINTLSKYIVSATKTGWKYCDYSLRDFTRRFKIHSAKLIEREKEIR